LKSVAATPHLASSQAFLFAGNTWQASTGPVLTAAREGWFTAYKHHRRMAISSTLRVGDPRCDGRQPQPQA